MPRSWRIPEGLWVTPDGSWRVGELPVAHAAGLRYLKEHLVTLVVDESRGEARVVLDDGSTEAIHPDSLGMDRATGRFVCAVRNGRARAWLSRAAHQTLLAHAEEESGAFFLRLGARRVPIRT